MLRLDQWAHPNIKLGHGPDRVALGSVRRSRRMRVLFSSTGGEGHVQPMLPWPLVAHSPAASSRPRPPRDASSIGAAGSGCGDLAGAWPGAGGEYARRWPDALHLPVEEATVHMYPRLFGAVAAPAAYPDLLEVARGLGPDLVVHEAAEYAAPAVAAVAGGAFGGARDRTGDSVRARRGGVRVRLPRPPRRPGWTSARRPCARPTSPRQPARYPCGRRPSSESRTRSCLRAVAQALDRRRRPPGGPRHFRHRVRATLRTCAGRPRPLPHSASW